MLFSLLALWISASVSASAHALHTSDLVDPSLSGLQVFSIEVELYVEEEEFRGV